MENNNDDGVVKVDLGNLQAADVQETVHKVNLDAPASASEQDNTDQDGVTKVNMESAQADSEESENENSSDSAVNTSGSSIDDFAEQSSDDASISSESGDSDSEISILEEITEIDEDTTIESKEGDNESQATIPSTEDSAGPILPENVEKLVEFINETGGTIEDYVKLNVDVDTLDDAEVLREYHKALEPSLDSDEIDLIMEDLYDVDEDIMDDREMKRKLIDKKRDLGKAKKHLQSQKDKYYDEIKAGSSLTPDQKKAVDFFNRHSEAQEADLTSRTQKQTIFADKTNKLFNEEFKGFEFKVGEKRYRYNVKDVEGTKLAQSNIENFTKKYLGDEGSLKDEKGYHKALFTAMNADAIADHFYKQGQADAVKTSSANKKNIDMDGRKSHGKSVPSTSGVKARVVAVEKGKSPGKLRFKTYQ